TQGFKANPGLKLANAFSVISCTVSFYHSLLPRGRTDLNAFESNLWGNTLLEHYLNSYGCLAAAVVLVLYKPPAPKIIRTFLRLEFGPRGHNYV
ncbi:MAG TPA: hypothetical protein VMS31_23435, partial [Pyrinomonadaceae bacterium]|nr:hypothetical protein [Pyrinomonadaceae bacterium]